MGGTNAEEENTGISASYTMGSMTVSGFLTKLITQLEVQELTTHQQV